MVVLTICAFAIFFILPLQLLTAPAEKVESPFSNSYFKRFDIGFDCTTPDNLNGTCKEIKDCYSIKNLLETRSEEATDYVKKSHCGFTVSEPLVCCAAHQLSVTTVFKHQFLPKWTECGKEIFWPLKYEANPTTTTTTTTQAPASGFSYAFAYGGTESVLNQHPWMALLKFLEDGNEKFLCGGTLISKRYVLTAAHCTKLSPNIDRQLVAARLGEHTISTITDCKNYYSEVLCADPVVDVGIEKVINHPSYKRKLNIHDISLIRLERNVEYSNYIQPICLPLPNSILPIHTYLSVVGWGETESSDHSDVKLFGFLPVVSSSDCGIKFGTTIPSNQFCAGGMENKDSCKGDSGGPALWQGTGHYNNQWLQEGIVSYGMNDCGIKGYPGVYTRVSKYVNWIVDNMAE